MQLCLDQTLSRLFELRLCPCLQKCMCVVWARRMGKVWGWVNLSESLKVSVLSLVQEEGVTSFRSCWCCTSCACCFDAVCRVFSSSSSSVKMRSILDFENSRAGWRPFLLPRLFYLFPCHSCTGEAAKLNHLKSLRLKARGRAEALRWKGAARPSQPGGRVASSSSSSLSFCVPLSLSLPSCALRFLWTVSCFRLQQRSRGIFDASP